MRLLDHARLFQPIRLGQSLACSCTLSPCSTGLSGPSAIREKWSDLNAELIKLLPAFLAIIVPGIGACFAFFRWRDARHFQDIDAMVALLKSELEKCEICKNDLTKRVDDLTKQMMDFLRDNPR